MAIKLLQDNLINKIAAGEVVERPASVVKELVENSIDAGATKISVNIMRGGLDLIEVEDNGSGIAPEELELAFQRHATSKISREEDLSQIATMGFRGEALPSIASVSKIELYSCQNDIHGIRAILQGGTLTETAPCPCPKGTRIIVSDIFYNTPARREFLKTPVTEGSNVHEVVNKLALSRPDISFKFSSQHKTYFKTPGTGDLMAAAAAIYGQDFSQNLVPAVYDSERYSITGLISVPEVTRASRKNQLFFINNRAIRSPMLYRAVDEGYRGLLITREFPVIMLFINMPGAEVDVNVHPQKNEVRFRDDKVIFRLVTEVIRTTLDKLDYRFNLPASGAQAAPGLGHDTTQIPIYRHQHFDFSSVPKESSGSSYQCETELPTANTWQFPRTDREDQELPPYRVVGQCFDSYILLEKGQELILIDQHAAHERINYERLRSSVGETNVQALAFPVSVQLPLNGMQLLEQNLTTLAGLGFDLDIIGPQEIAIRTAPWAARGHEKESVLEILDLWQEEKAIDLTDEACKMLACKKSIKAGQVLTRLEMEKIIADLLKCTDYKNCPHGRPVLLNISRTEMDHHFKRN